MEVWHAKVGLKKFSGLCGQVLLKVFACFVNFHSGLKSMIGFISSFNVMYTKRSLNSHFQSGILGSWLFILKGGRLEGLYDRLGNFGGFMN